MEIPRTWAALGQSAAKLYERQSAGELPQSVSSVIAQPLSPGWAARNLLARVASSIRDRRRYSDVFALTSMEPRIDLPPFVRALEELIADQQRSADPAARLTPEEVYAAVCDGRAAMGIGCWPFARGEPGAAEASTLLGFALLPGAGELYSDSDNAWSDRDEVLQVPLLAAGGHVGSVVHGTRRQRVAWNLLRQLASPEWSTTIGPAGHMAAPFRQSHLTELRPWVGEELADESVAQLRSGLQEYYAADVTLTVLRIPYAAEYLKVLDEAVLSALEGRVTAQAALSEASQQWSQLVERHGRKRQAEAYLRGFSVLE
jgi:hypothetical protein